MAEKRIKTAANDVLTQIMTRHGGKIVLGGFIVAVFAMGGCAEILDNFEEGREKKEQEEADELMRQIESQFETDGFDATSIDTLNQTAKLILGACQVNAEFSPKGSGYNGYDALEDITGYTVTQETDDGSVTRITEFENSFDLQEQVGENPCAYFFVD